MVADKPGERAEEEGVVLSKTEIFEEHPGRVGQRKSPVLIIVMGVSGCGKSSVGAGLAAKVCLASSSWLQAPASCGVIS
jgi:2-phosphoglycerate kinase